VHTIQKKKKKRPHTNSNLFNLSLTYTPRYANGVYFGAWQIEKKTVESLRTRHKTKRSYEYEVKWLGKVRFFLCRILDVPIQIYTHMHTYTHTYIHTCIYVYVGGGAGEGVVYFCARNVCVELMCRSSDEVWWRHKVSDT